MNPGSKIYVAGHTGLVGSAILRKLKEKGYNNLVYREYPSLDLTRQTDVEKFFEEEKPEYVFLAAARVGGILANNTYKANFIYDNLSIATNVIHSAYKSGTKKLLNLGSSCIYPKLAPQPIKEEYLLKDYLEPTNEPYAIAKIAAIKLCRYFNEQYGTNYISIMPTNLYGPNDNFNLETAHVLPALIRKFLIAKYLSEKKYDSLIHDIQRFPPGFGYNFDPKKNTTSDLINFLEKIGITSDTVTLWGTGTPYREFLYVDDLADAGVFLMENYDYRTIGELVNVGTGKDSTIAEIATLVKKIVGFNGEIRWDKTKPDGTPRKLLDVSKLNNLKWKYKTSLEQGIRLTIDWYNSQIK